MKTLNLLISLILLGIFISCGDDETEVVKQDPLYPLAVGNSWTYDNTNYNGGNPNTTTTQTTVQSSYTIDGKTGFALSEYIEGNPISLIKNDNNGNTVEYLFNNNKFVHNTIVFKKDVKKGDSWIRKSAVFTDDDNSQYEIEEWEMTCITSDTIITTPKGDFQCIGYSYHPGGKQENGDPNHTMIDYLSEKIGLVKSLHYEHENANSWLFREIVLKDYSLQ